jgi:AsmA protein
MRSPVTRILFRVLKITGITAGSLLLLLFLLPYLFPGFVSDKIRQWARHSVQAELHFSRARLSFFRHFPALTLSLDEVKLNGSTPFEKETLLEADELAFGVDLTSIFSEVKIDKIFLTHAFFNILVDTGGRANYNIYVSKKSDRPAAATDSSGASLQIKKIIIKQSRLTYNDQSVPLLINVRGLDYRGSGDLSQAIFDLQTHMQMEALDLYYDRTPYLINKKFNADLVTRINTRSLDLLFEKNDMLINQLPVAMTGRFTFRKEGYDIDFELQSTDTKLHDMFTALPADVLDWLDSTDVRGFGELHASLKGKYDAATGENPDFLFNMKIRDGTIAYAKAPVPVSNLYLDFRAKVPGLNTDSLDVHIDSVFFNLDKGFFAARLRGQGLKAPWVSGQVRADLDLEKWDRALGFAPAQLKGHLRMQLETEGRFATRVERVHSLRAERTSTVIASIPRFSLVSSLRDGYFKLSSRPEAISQVHFDLDAGCRDGDYKHSRVRIDSLNAAVLGSVVHGFFHYDGAAVVPLDGAMETTLHLADLRKAIPMDSLDLAGDLVVHARTRGSYDASRRQFPVTEADLRLDNGRLQTKYYPHPMENIQVGAHVTSSSGSLRDLAIAITPVSFLFEGQPFLVKADLQDFDDLRYNIVSRGTLDLDRILQVFNWKDFDVTGFIETRLSLRGRQSDATAGRYDRLFNEGSLKVKDLVVNSELFPLPFHIYTGDFRFLQDKMWFDRFDAGYGASRFTLDGWLTDVLGYLDHKGQALRGEFQLKSNYVLVDELMAFGGSGYAGSSGAMPRAAAADPPKQKGVILIPGDLAVGFHAAIRKVEYNGLRIDSFRGGVSIDSGAVRLDTTTFTLAGAPAQMDARYRPLSPQRAQFDYHIQAKDFDVQRAYREVPLFRELAASAADAQGIISLDYRLAGRLDSNMMPVYPSLKGGGVVSISKVKIRGLRLFSEVTRETKKDVTDPDLSKVDIKSSIANNLVTIGRTRMKISVFKFRFEGQTSLDGRLNLKCRVGLPPFGVIGIPVTVTGTQTKPIVKARKAGKGDELEETVDKDEETQQR